MIKQLAASMVLVLSVACASTPMHSSDNAASAGGSNAFTNDARSYILLDSPAQIRTMEYSRTVRGLYVRGTLTNKGFMPAASIEGSGSFCAEGKDWLSLTDLTVHKASDGKTPVAPYIAGCANGSSFSPATRDIVTQ